MRTDIPSEPHLVISYDPPSERKLLMSAYDALRSYQYGNSSTELAEEIADAIGLYFSGGKQ